MNNATITFNHLSFCGGTKKYELTESGQDGSGPEDLPHECRDEEKAPHAFPVHLLERVQHGDVASRAHGLGEKKTTWDKGCTENRLRFHGDPLHSPRLNLHTERPSGVLR